MTVLTNLDNWRNEATDMINRLDTPMATEAAAGITGGTGTVCINSVVTHNDIIETTIFVDLTGLDSVATDLDIIGTGASAAHIGQITAAVNGTIVGGSVTCLELPAGGDPNVALYAASEATGVLDGGIAALTETLVVDPAADWTNGAVKGMTTVPPADSYLYLVQGDASGTAASYTAGKFLIKMYGVAA